MPIVNAEALGTLVVEVDRPLEPDHFSVAHQEDACPMEAGLSNRSEVTTDTHMDDKIPLDISEQAGSVHLPWLEK
jgi:hypothetical protein